MLRFDVGLGLGLCHGPSGCCSILRDMVSLEALQGEALTLANRQIHSQQVGVRMASGVCDHDAEDYEGA